MHALLVESVLQGVRRPGIVVGLFSTQPVTMEAIATVLGVEVANAQASTMQERVQLRSLPSKWPT